MTLETEDDNGCRVQGRCGVKPRVPSASFCRSPQLPGTWRYDPVGLLVQSPSLGHSKPGTVSARAAFPHPLAISIQVKQKASSQLIGDAATMEEAAAVLTLELADGQSSVMPEAHWDWSLRSADPKSKAVQANG
jgi:hypothetical protein